MLGACLCSADCNGCGPAQVRGSWPTHCVLSFHPRQQIGSCSPCVAGFLLAFPVVSHCCSPLSASRLLHALVSRFARCPVGAVLSSASISVYLAMPCGECRTDSLLRSLFEAGQSVYIPRVTGSGRTDMQMLRVESLAQLESFPRSRWGIPEPTAVQAAAMDDGTASGAIDLVVVPGVAFDHTCKRLGHGRGYYDTFLEQLGASTYLSCRHLGDSRCAQRNS